MQSIRWLLLLLAREKRAELTAMLGPGPRIIYKALRFSGKVAVICIIYSVLLHPPSILKTMFTCRPADGFSLLSFYFIFYRMYFF